MRWKETDPNAIPLSPAFTAFVIGLIMGAHTELARAGRALHGLLGLPRWPGADTVREVFHRFTQGAIQQSSGGHFGFDCWAWRPVRRAAKAGFLVVLFALDVLSLYPRGDTPTPRYRQPATLRVAVFLCGDIPGRSGHQAVLHSLVRSVGRLEKTPTTARSHLPVARINSAEGDTTLKTQP